MEIKVNDIINGFKVTRVREVKELSGTFAELEHIKTGAELCWFNNGEANKLFSVAFKTLPEDSTGVFHILEHSVLCGSDNFPVKEPFVELLKGSMNTFLNAMTFQDKTMYPVSSRNEQDFLNLTRVYLDAVFKPAILHKPEIFCQEGWHMEEDEENGASYKGVVFNEMKGALSSGEDMAQEKLLTLLFAGTPYGVNSGGDPRNIPDLTYEQFVETYKRFYHPSNSRIYLDGNVPLEKTLALIDSYLAEFERSVKIPDARYVGKAAVSAAVKYEVDKTESLEDKGMLLFGKIIGTWRDKVKVMAASILSNVLLGTNDSPLKRAVLSAGLAQDVSMWVDDSVQQPYCAVMCKNVKDGCEEELRKLIADTAKKIAADGLPRTRLEAAIARYEFGVREQEEPQGLIRNIVGLNSWLHDGDPLDYMVFDQNFADLRKMMNEGGFEALMLEMFEDRSGEAFLRVLPSYTAGDELREAEKQRIEKIRAGWSEEQLEANRELCRRIKTWQETPDSEEALATLPALELSEVSPEPLIPPTEESVKDGVTVLFHKVPCHGLTHSSMYFDISDFSTEELIALSRAGSYLGVLPTEKHSSEELQELLEGTVGRMNFGLKVTGDYRDPESCKVYFAVNTSTLSDKYEAGIALAQEILLQTKFDEKDKLKEIAAQNYENDKLFCVRRGNGLGITEALGGFGARGVATEAVSGYTAMKYGSRLAQDFDNTVPSMLDAFARLRECFNTARLVVSLSSDVCPDAADIISAFPAGSGCKGDAPRAVSIPEKSGIPIPAQIGFAASGWNFRQAGYEYDGSMAVASNILSLDYLWNVVRVRGGAYGAGMSAGRSGNMQTYSYRDPSPAATRNVTAAAGDYLREYVANTDSIVKYIISTIADTEPLVSPRIVGSIGDDNWFQHVSAEDLRRERSQILAADKAGLLKFAELCDKMAAGRRECVVAFRDALEAQKDLEIMELA